MKKLFLFGACFLALASSPMLAQTGNPEVVVLQLYFTGGNSGLSNGHLSLTRPTGTSETEFKNMTSRQEEAVAYQRVFTQLYQEGYSLKSTVSRGVGLCTWIFVKGEKTP